MKPKLRLIIIVLSLLLTSLLASCAKNRPVPSEKNLEALELTFLKVGKADASVLQTGESCLIIDTGEEDDGDELCEFLNNKGISRVNVLIITHFDKDHIGGADKLIERFPVDRVIIPDYKSKAKQYKEFIAALSEKGIEPERLRENLEFPFGTASVLVEPPITYPNAAEDGEIDNDCSLITTITHGELKFLFMGDAEDARIREWLDSGSASECYLMKVPHHGVYSPALKDLFEATRPQTAVICDSDKNPADERTLALLESIGAEPIIETRYGNYTITSRGISAEGRQIKD